MGLLEESKELLDFLRDIGKYAQSYGSKIYIVGGYVRDAIFEKLTGQSLNKELSNSKNPKISTLDLDLLVEGDAVVFLDKYLKEYSSDYDKNCIKILETFDAFKTIKVSVEGVDALIELASSRTETYPKPAAFPKVKLGASVEEDLPRRDFTINAILQSIMPNDFGEIIDPINGQSDIENKIIKVFHDNSFVDDPTRIYRVARFMAKFNFAIENKTLSLIKEASLSQDFSNWYKKRKNRFEIEFGYIEQLDSEQKDKAIKFLDSLGLIFI